MRVISFSSGKWTVLWQRMMLIGFYHWIAHAFMYRWKVYAVGYVDVVRTIIIDTKYNNVLEMIPLILSSPFSLSFSLYRPPLYRFVLFKHNNCIVSTVQSIQLLYLQTSNKFIGNSFIVLIKIGHVYRRKDIFNRIFSFFLYNSIVVQSL